MNLFAGLEKFGFQQDASVDLFADEKDEKKNAKDGEAKKADEPTEEEFLLEKTIRCTVCDKVIKTKMVKSGRVKRLEPDMDLRPRHMYIDTLKYDTSSCPYCGYTAMNRYFEHLSSVQIKLIKEQVCSNYRPERPVDLAVYDYDTAIDMHKLSLLNAIVKKAKTSEKAYNCLIISWLLRGKAETLEKSQPQDKEKLEECRKEEEAFYQQAYDGLMKAVATEMFPICGMDACTVDYLLATMAFHFKQYDVVSKSLSSVITSVNAGNKIKDKARELKEKLMEEIKNNK